MNKLLSILAVASLAIAACSTTVPEEPEVQRANATPRATLNTVTVGGQSVRTLADAVTAGEIERRARLAAAAGFEGDNKGNACFQEPVFRGVVGGELASDQTRRREFWTYSVCGESYEVPVTVTKRQGSATVDFSVGSGREAR
ncbi:hypothetical protein [Parvularcula lutaonensis]|uniref:Lipoprotein n=1 Tax=Parvularcula lutaonensis TaxID=491923 RepID=A0ABV7MER5_9PROT|nr:hypothetical protein [Parvularcula lutaonensis]GGY40352.1 hypothetical protein GCM10007148_06050 [Parvularcula lutaonensis]